MDAMISEQVAGAVARPAKSPVDGAAKLAYTVEEAADAAAIGRTSLYRAIKDGELRARKHGRRTVILRADLENFLTKLLPVAA